MLAIVFVVADQIFARGEKVWDGTLEESSEVLLVVWGMVRGILEVNGVESTFYMGSGSAFGMVNNVIGAYVPGVTPKVCVV